MTITIKGRKYDYAADCLDCQNEHGVFESHAEREEWRKGHEGHDVDLYLQAHSATNTAAAGNTPQWSERESSTDTLP